MPAVSDSTLDNCPEHHATPNPALAAVWPHVEAEISFLRRAVRRWHREGADADDLVQETLLRALANVHQWQVGTSMRAWLLTIMRHQFLTILARTQRMETVDEETIGTADWRAANQAEVRLILRDVERAFRRLPAKQRSAVLLAGVEDKSYSEVAALTGVSVDAVRCHLARARRRLRQAVYHCDDRTWLKPIC